MTTIGRIVAGAHRLAIAVTLVAALVAGRASAETIYWNGEGLPWSATTSWSIDGTATTPNPAAVSGILDDVIFGITSIGWSNSSSAPDDCSRREDVVSLVALLARRRRPSWFETSARLSGPKLMRLRS